MEEPDLKNLLRGARQRPTRGGRRCPDDRQLAAFVEQRLGDSERAAMEAHLADCDSCRGQVSFLIKAAEWPAPAPVPHHLLREARGLVSGKPRGQPSWGWRWAGAAAAAACLILTVGIFIVLRSGGPEIARSDEPLVAQTEPLKAPAVIAQTNSSTAGSQTPPAPTPDPRPRPVEPRPKTVPAPQSRGAEIQGLSPTLLSPREGAMLARGDLEFRWEPVPDAVFYEVSVVTAAGDSAFAKKTEATRLSLPDDISLASGAKYYVTVRAYLRGGKTAKSGFVSFHVLN
jgi:hypothetical protein